MTSFVEWISAIYVVLGRLSLLLACVGLGGVTACAVAQRSKEIGIRMAPGIGIRMALGTHGRHVQGLVLREGTALVVVCSVCGLAGAMALVRAFSA
ncbi:MAG: hypothetical protein NTW28_29060 [Candidatus Solibacter sp.]|nr:hypothetical protein [Candidatus Solibacter sp.]